MEIMEGKVSEEQTGFRKGKGCVDQIFAIEMMLKEYLRKDEKLCSFHGPRKRHVIKLIGKLWNSLKIYGVGGQLLEEITAFYREASAYVRVDEELSERFHIGVGVRQGCVMSLWLFNIFIDGGCRWKTEDEWNGLGSGGVPICRVKNLREWWMNFIVYEGFGRRNKRPVKGRCIIGSLASIMRGRNVSLEVKKDFRISILLPTLTNGPETWT